MDRYLCGTTYLDIKVRLNICLKLPIFLNTEIATVIIIPYCSQYFRTNHTKQNLTEAFHPVCIILLMFPKTTVFLVLTKQTHVSIYSRGSQLSLKMRVKSGWCQFTKKTTLLKHLYSAYWRANLFTSFAYHLRVLTFHRRIARIHV